MSALLGGFSEVFNFLFKLNFKCVYVYVCFSLLEHFCCENLSEFAL